MATVTAMAGYAHPDFAKVYASMGEPVFLPASGGFLLRRAIPGTHYYDLMGFYPIFCCVDWMALREDLASLQRDNVSLVLVADPFAEGGVECLQRIFDSVRAFKTHFVADLSQPLDSIVPASRIRAARKSLRELDLSVAPEPTALVDDWIDIQEQARHAGRASGTNRLSRAEVELLFQVPGIVVLRAASMGRTVGMHVEFHQDNVVFGHFAGYSTEGYRLGASAALHIYEMEYFAGKARWIDWGGVPGTQDSESGLSRFKQNFSNTTRMSYLCCSIFDKSAYDYLSNSRSLHNSNYFPSYRATEIGQSRGAMHPNACREV